MSTEIKSTFAPENTSIELGPLTGYRDNPCMYLSINDDMGHALANFTRADFLAAVATECNVRIVPADAIAIERGELPGVVRRDERNVMIDGLVYPAGPSASADEYRAIAVRALALADHLDANPPKPPVDEGLVAAVGAAYDASDRNTFFDVKKFAEALQSAGVRIEAQS